MKIKIKKNIKEIPFNLLEKERTAIVNAYHPDNVEKMWQKYLKSDNNWLTAYGIKDFSSWIYPQLLALLSEMKLNKENGIINGTKFWMDNIDIASDWWKGLVRFIKIDPRGLTLNETQYKDPGRQYCSLVPIVLAAHKLYNDIPYNSWDRNTLHSVVNKSLADAMLWTYDFEPYTTNQLLEIRAEGLTIKSGKKSGNINSPETSFKLYGVEDDNFKDIPGLAQVMLTQIWCAHPSNRTKYMVLNPLDWDNIPQPLLSCDIFLPKEDNNYIKREEMPWE